MCPLALREVAWKRLSTDLESGKLSEITHEIGLDDVIGAGGSILSGQVRGRIVVKIS
jgi:acrylyl-CoA reductase (NADPH)